MRQAITHAIWQQNQRVQRSSLQQQVSVDLLGKFCFQLAGEEPFPPYNLCQPYLMARLSQPASPHTPWASPALLLLGSAAKWACVCPHTHTHSLRNSLVMCKTLVFLSACHSSGAKQSCRVSHTWHAIPADRTCPYRGTPGQPWQCDCLTSFHPLSRGLWTAIKTKRITQISVAMQMLSSWEKKLKPHKT